MARTNEPLASRWQGLNRITAAFMLPESQSPDTTDAAPYLDKDFILGPRRGRTNIAHQNYRIQGVIPFNIPGLTGRIVADINGFWNANLQPWSNSVAPTPPAGTTIDELDITIAALTAVNLVDAFSGTQAVGPFDLSTYDLIIGTIQGANFSNVSQSSATQSNGAFAIEGLIGGVWTLLTYAAQGGNSVGSVIDVAQKPAAGSLTSIRGHLLAASLAGASITISASAKLYLIKGAVPNFAIATAND